MEHNAYRLLRHHGDPMAIQLTGAGSDEMAADCRPQQQASTAADFSLPFFWLLAGRSKLLHFGQKRTRTVTRAADGEMKSDPAPLLGFPCPSWPPFLFHSLGFWGRFCCNPHSHTTRQNASAASNVQSTEVAGCRQNGGRQHFPSKKEDGGALFKNLSHPPPSRSRGRSVCVCVCVYFYLLLFKSSFLAKLKHVDCSV
jgi:hypothetical protein